MTHPGDGQSGWGGQPGQGDWGPQDHGYPQQQGYPQPQGYPEQVYPPQQQGYPEPVYPQQGYAGSYGGLGVFSGGDEPPPKKNRAKLWPAIAAVVVVLVGGGVTAYVLTRPDGSTPVTQGTTGSSAAKTTTGTPKSTASSAPNATCEPAKSGWNCLPVPALAYSYDVPKGWSPSPRNGPVEGMEGVELTGMTVNGAYDCADKSFNRGGAGGALVPQADLTATAKDFAQKLATQYYNSAPKSEVKLGEPKPVKIRGTRGEVEGVQVDAIATTSGDQCLATKGVVKVLVLQGDKALHVFMANGDLEGGPAEPKPPTDAELQGMVDSVRPLSR